MIIGRPTSNLRRPKRARILASQPGTTDIATAGSRLIQQTAARYLPTVVAGVLLGWLSFLVTDGQPELSLSVYGPTLVFHALVGLLGVTYALWLVLRRRLPGPTRLDLAAAGLVFVYVAAILDSAYPRVSWEASLLVASAVLTFYVFHDAPISTDAIVRILAAVGGIAGVLALVDVGDAYSRWLCLVDAVDGSIATSDLMPPSVPRIDGVGGHVNIIAMAFNLTLPFAVALVLQPRVRYDRWLGAVCALLCAVGLFFTLSRGAWLGTFVAVLVFASLYLLRHRDVVAAGSRLSPRQRRLLLAVAVGALIVLAVGVFGIGQWDSRPEWLFRASLSARQDAVSTGWEIFRERPFFGAGPHTYPLLYNIYSGAYPIENVHPHNGYVTALVDTGLAGAAVLLAAAAMLLYALWRAYAIGDAGRRTLVAAGVAGLASLAVHSFLETPNIWSTSLLPLAAVLAVCLRLAPPTTPRTTAPVIAALPRLGAAVTVLSLLSFVYFDRAHSTYESSLEELRGGDFMGSSRDATDAARQDDTFAVYGMHAAVTSAIGYEVDLQSSASTSPARLDEAIARLRRVVEREPRSAVGYANLALVLRLRADSLDASTAENDIALHDSLQVEAVEASRAAIERADTDSTIAAVAGTVFEWAARDLGPDVMDEARDAYALALSHDAGLVQSPFWATNPVRTAMRTRALEASELTACEKGRVSVIYAGFRDNFSTFESQCREHVATAPGDARARSDLAIILFGLGRFDDAKAEAASAAALVPDNPFVRTALGVTLMPEGDIKRIRHELMLGAYLGDPDAALFLSYTYAPGGIRRSNNVVANLGIPNTPDTIPDAVVDRLQTTLTTAAPMFLDHGVQRYRLGILYYRVRFRRESPASIIVPGEWITFASPRALLMLSELDFARSDAGRR